MEAAICLPEWIKHDPALQTTEALRMFNFDSNVNLHVYKNKFLSHTDQVLLLRGTRLIKQPERAPLRWWLRHGGNLRGGTRNGAPPYWLLKSHGGSRSGKAYCTMQLGCSVCDRCG